MLSHSWRWYDFSKIQIFGLKAHMLSLTTNTVGCFSCNDWLTLFIFQKISAKYLRFNNHSFVSHSFQWKWCSVKKKKNQPGQLTVQTAILDFSMWHKCSSHTSHVITQNVKTTCTWGARFDQINNFDCLIKDILKCKWIFFWLRAHGHEEHARRTVWRHWRRLLWGTCSLTHPQSRSQRDKKR